MIFVDSSVWIDYFCGRGTPEAETLDRHLGVSPVAVGDLVLPEVLQGFRSDRDYKIAIALLDLGRGQHTFRTWRLNVPAQIGLDYSARSWRVHRRRDFLRDYDVEQQFIE